MANTSQQFPAIQVPLVDVMVDEKGVGTGKITQIWLQLFISLWKRTGAAQGMQTVQPGTISAMGMASAPDGWLVCNGAAVSRAAFANLFSAIGTTWGVGDGTTTFNLPDLRNSFLRGEGAQVVGDSGGAATATLSTTNLPSHNHAVTDPGHVHGVTDPGHTHGVTDPGHVHTAQVQDTMLTAGAAAGSAKNGNTNSATTGVTVNSNTTGVSVDSHTTGVTTQNTGSGTAFPIVPPYAVVLWAIKT